jgi:hypothetical protein
MDFSPRPKCYNVIPPPDRRSGVKIGPPWPPFTPEPPDAVK